MEKKKSNDKRHTIKALGDNLKYCRGVCIKYNFNNVNTTGDINNKSQKAKQIFSESSFRSLSH